MADDPGPQQLFIDLIEAWPDPVMVLDSECERYVFANDAAARLLGYDRSELLERSPSDLSGPGLERTGALASASLERCGGWQGCWRLRHKDGSLVEVDVTLARQIVGGQVVHQGIFRERAARDSSDLGAGPGVHLFEASSQAIVAFDMQGVVTFWNRAAERMYGRSAHQAVGHALAELIPPGPARADADAVVGRLLQGQIYAGQITVAHFDGRTFTAHLSGSPIRDDSGKQIGVLGVAVKAEAVDAGIARSGGAEHEAPETEAVGGRTRATRMRRAVIECASCGQKVAGTTRRRYCSEKCRQWAYYHRHLEEQRARSRQRHARLSGIQDVPGDVSVAEASPSLDGLAAQDVSSPDATASADAEAR
ncbi:MAG: PAS domain S-box protein [Chloroflexi bacterium]|nr:PAS domain S-box protein [Chloroflexota bacterium]